MRKPEHFINGLMNLAANDLERARLLGCSPRSITRYKNGKSLPNAEKLFPFPHLIELLLLDAKQAAQTTEADAAATASAS